jgi:hypothetical protein
VTLSADLSLVEAALDRLEQREVRVLVWGLVDSALSETEVFEVLNGVLDDPDHGTHLASEKCTLHAAEDLLTRLVELGLLFRVPERRVGEAPRWRTRMAEGLRLMTRLRQLMPRHMERPGGWIAAPTLVADYRLLWRRRRYPKRKLGPEEALEELQRHVSSDETIDAVRHWLGKASPDWRLSRFQLEAAARVLGSLDRSQVSGTLVSAGTGSGKTLAFYLPALSWLAARRLAEPHQSGVRILAIYPRNELLKDQLSEVYGQSRKFDDLLGGAGSKPLSVGVLFSDTPEELKDTAYWKDRVCPFFRCPKPGCDSPLHVTEADIKAKVERLTCHCGATVPGARLRLTRTSMRDAPPDVLFTSVEMLNQRMSDSSMRHLFGLGPGAASVPSLVLLDEVHVYSGTYGAQVAHLLRRWLHLTGRQSIFVGLSATISEGERFFSSLTGLKEALVKEVTPRPEDMESEGAEYLVALRGDPVTQAALLSTTIQTLMLGSRLLDPRGKFDKQARPFAGWRAFAFSEQMDGTNRLYSDLRDAEGWDWRGNPSPRGNLAQYRRPDPSNRQRFEAGQDWSLPNRIGHDLGYRNGVSRTTAYDAGVANDTEVVVATAALEVGYDDEAVGLVLQHKAPRDMAQFLQRKGRAGRTRHMRPWTIMVLSDYGRDRMAYQSYEQYFDPELPARDLPLANRYVQRMQAVYALVDYLGIQLQAGYPRGSVWRDLAEPQPMPEGATKEMSGKLRELARTNPYPLSESQAKAVRMSAWSIVRSLESGQATNQARRNVNFRIRRVPLIHALEQLLQNRDRSEELAQHLMASLSLPRQVVDALLWEHPRPVLMEAVPTALRRLATFWKAGGVAGAEYRDRHPLPEFIPATLFSDLSLPEVRIERPHNDAERYLPVQQALSELAPGKVSKRFDQPLWLGVDKDVLLEIVGRGEADPAVEVEVGAWYDLDHFHHFQQSTESGPRRLLAFRPRVIRLQPPPPGGAPGFPLVGNTSNARLVWSSQVFARRQGHQFAPPHAKVGIAALVSTVHAHTHGAQCPATVRRYAVGSRASLRLGGPIAAAAGTGDKTIDQRVEFRFMRHGEPCGVGFEIEVDALRIDLDLPAEPHRAIDLGHGPTLRALRAAHYFWEARHGPALRDLEPNDFLRPWIAEIFLTAAMRRCSETGDTLVAAVEWVAAAPQNLDIDSILETLFQAPARAPGDEADPDSADDDEEAGATGKLRLRLRACMTRPEVIASLRSICAKALGPVDASWDNWLASLMKHTLAAAWVEAIQNACPQVDVGDLAVDTGSGPSETGASEEGHRIWITEVNPGGNGLVEQVVEAVATDAAGFYRQVEVALSASEFEVIDEQLRDFMRRIGAPEASPVLVARTEAVRNSQGTVQAQQAVAALRHELVNAGHSVFHGYVAALANRMLRPGTPRALDTVIHEFLDQWQALEHRLEVEVDARVVCATFSSDTRIDDAFAGAGIVLPPFAERRAWRFSMLMGVMWARGHALRASALPLSMRYSALPAVTERLILQGWLTRPDTPVDAGASGWLDLVHGRLRTQGRTSVVLAQHDGLLTEVMQALTTQPVQMEYLNVYPRLKSIVRTVDSIELRLELAETL